ncbi:MAG: hypothetical protein GYB46_13720, partial [Rhodobacteraceae bacterium]|nr:hypothetical protein [Paracoccaceae bacterium]
GDFAPVVIKAGALNNMHDLVVSPEHRLFVYQRQDKLGIGRAETLVRAKHLVNGKDVHRLDDGYVEYYQLLIVEHQIIYAEGIATESLLLRQTAFNQCGEPAPSSLARVKFVFPRILNAQELPSADARNIGKS